VSKTSKSSWFPEGTGGCQSMTMRSSIVLSLVSRSQATGRSYVRHWPIDESEGGGLESQQVVPRLGQEPGA
jgi:hypothetical protein